MQAIRSAGMVLAILCGVSYSPSLAQRPLRPQPLILASAPAELIDRLRADPFTYFRFINRAWTERVCEAFADLPTPTIVRLHGDAHVEQFALTQDTWGLDDFDDSTRGPAFIDVVRFLGSLDLASRQRGWLRARDRLWTRFFEGYRLGLSNPDFRPREPEIVGKLRQAPLARAAYLEWGERQMQPLDEARSTAIVSGMEAFERLMRGERPDLAPGYFTVKRAGWLRIGVGSATIRKILIRVSGPTADPDDDVLLEGKEVVSLGGVRCLETPTTQPAIRVIAGARQLGRLKHDILAIAPTVLLPPAAEHAEHWLDWWISSWEPTYREVHVNDLGSADDLADIAFVSGWQLGTGKVPSVKNQELSSNTMLEARLRKETSLIVEELIAGWRELAGRP